MLRIISSTHTILFLKWWTWLDQPWLLIHSIYLSFRRCSSDRIHSITLCRLYSWRIFINSLTLSLKTFTSFIRHRKFISPLRIIRWHSLIHNSHWWDTTILISKNFFLLIINHRPLFSQNTFFISKIFTLKSWNY